MAWAPDYLTDAEFKSYIRLPAGDTADAAEIALAISAASRAVDRATRRQFGQTATAEDRYYTGHFDRELCRWVVEFDDVHDITGMTVHLDPQDDGTFPDALTEYRLVPLNAAQKGRPFEGLFVRPSSLVLPSTVEGGVRVHVKFGWNAFPPTIKQATGIQANRFLARRDSPYGVAGSPEAGNEMRLSAKLDPDVRLMLRSAGYYRYWGAA